MPTIDLSDEELQGLVTVLATASGPGISWMLTNTLLTKVRQAQEAAQPVADALPARKPNSKGEDHAAISRA